MSPEPTPADRFLRFVIRSGLIPRERLQTALATVTPDVRSDPARLAQQLIRDDLLTAYQANKLLQGAWQGLVLGPYHILAPLGKGGMGTVYLARDTRGPRLVALKVLPPKRAREEERTLARFRREMEMARKVSHPNLTQTHDAGVLQGVYYIAMEYIRGAPLSRQIQTGGTLLVPRAARLFAEAAAGIEHAHQQGLIHRDLKPSNIMVTPNGHAKVLDLGMAIVQGEVAGDDKTIIGGVGYILGTMDYIAPEQAEDSTKVDARSDLYALGCTMYFALTGRPPFPGGTSLDKILCHRESFPDAITELNPTIPSEFAQIVERLMAKRPDRRFASAAALREALLPWAAGEPERPLDVEVAPDEADAVHQVEAEHAREATVWESIPVIVFAEHAKKPEPPAALSASAVVELPAPERPERHGVSVLVLLVGSALLLTTMLALEFLRRG